jgi:glucose-1-phosphate cytidylyltransferase
MDYNMSTSLKVILCGGKGTRLREETEYRPKPMITIGTKPILWHIMKTYSHFGYRDFILCLGYKGDVIREFFLNYETFANDFTIRLGRRRSIKYLHHHDEDGWRITLCNTGENTMTGGRVARIAPHIDSDLFMLTYGDGVGDVDIPKLLAFHRSHGKLVTLTGVCPPSRFGEIAMDGNRVIEFNEKPQAAGGLINGGFFVLHKKAFRYFTGNDSEILEREPLQQLARDGQLMVYQHKGFWQPMDTFREFEMLNELWASGNAPWKLW